MAYYGGMVSSYEELLNVLVNSCVEQGWTWTSGILSKGKVFVKPHIQENGVYEAGEGLTIQLGTNQSGSSLVNATNAKARIGKVASDGWGADFSFPVVYNIHISNDIHENEVYMVIKTGVETYLYLAFGQSDVAGYGAWMSSITPQTFSSMTESIITIDPSFDGQSSSFSKIRAPFWQSRFNQGYVSSESCCEVCRDETANSWLNDSPNEGIVAIAYASVRNLVGNQPSSWSSNGILLPINVYAQKLEQKNSQILSIKNARYIRIDNYEPEQIITLGMDAWKVYPFYKKNSVERDGPSNPYSGVGHSGTFGWAIRYDGP